MKEEKLCMFRVFREDGKYHFVNFTHNHICQCGFDTIEDAIQDLENYKQQQKIKDYQRV